MQFAAVPVGNSILLATHIESGDAPSLCGRALVGTIRSQASLEAEIIVLRHQLNVLRRNSRKRPTFGLLDRLIFASGYRLVPTVLDSLVLGVCESDIPC